MNVLLANKFFFLQGGCERVFFQERDFLRSRGINVIDFSMNDPRNFPSPYSDFFVSNIDYHAPGTISQNIKKAAGFIHSTEAIKKIDQLIEKTKPDIAHLHNIYHQLTPSIITTLKKRGVRVVLTLHDGKLVCPNYIMLKRGEICTACNGRYFWRPVTKKCQGTFVRELLFMLEAFWHKWRGSYQSVDLFIAPSRFIADLVSCRIPDNKIRVLHNGMDLDPYCPNFEDKGYGLYFGRLAKEKGIETLLDAHKILGDTLKLKIVGTGPIEEQLRRRYDSAEFLGFKQGDELSDIIARSAFVVVPSIWYENCAMAVLEAMALGKPLIASRVGGIPEQVEDGKTGFLFTMGNAVELAGKMRRLSESPDLRSKFGRAARKKVESTYSFRQHGRGLLELYQEVLSKTPLAQ